MEIGITLLSFSLLAGLLTTLSPCVLPLLPVVAAAAMARQRLGLFSLAFGLALSFTLVGTGFASFGLALGLEGQGLRLGAGLLMLLAACWLLSGRLQARFSARTARLGAGAQALLSGFHPDGNRGQLLVGALLGVAWTPCVGPTLGAAIVLAGQGDSLGAVSLVMLVFSLGAVIPLIGIGLLSRARFTRGRERLLSLGRGGRRLMGASLLVVALLVLTGLDKRLESWLLSLSPAWLIELTTRF
ncbi:cytochrome c biogenesis CcdA family protein [Zobellella maritima]|uniref:cytochrome c biogenesis CcdA family protein n=1 Tax=Zobellella maritima TaxID=2059725 RepID=UPI000E300898|nr:cytochrome c biogenesis CcdA family protein [Zobellella maritima]